MYEQVMEEEGGDWMNNGLSAYIKFHQGHFSVRIYRKSILHTWFIFHLDGYMYTGVGEELREGEMVT